MVSILGRALYGWRLWPHWKNVCKQWNERKFDSNQPNCYNAFMDILSELLTFLRMWGPFFGLILSAVGACVIFVGVRNQVVEAKMLDSLISSQPNKHADGKVLDKAFSVRGQRSKERLSAKTLEFIGMVVFVFGCILQAFGNFPVK